MRLATVGLIMLGVACSETTKGACESGACRGCCTSSNECLPGTTSLACGTSGQLCQPCATGLSCNPSSRQCITGSGGGSGGDGGAGGGGDGGAPSCSVPADCPSWFCNCQGITPVFMQRCVGLVCQDAKQACPGACAAVSSCWLGTSTGGFASGQATGASSCGGTGGGSGSCPATDLGLGCTAGTDCQTRLCYGAAPSFICTRSCTVPNDCPPGWGCALQSDSTSVCMLGQVGSGTPSSGGVCTEADIDDVGVTCSSSCKGGFCTRNKCTRRCVTANDCLSGAWFCTSNGAGLSSCTPP